MQGLFRTALGAVFTGMVAAAYSISYTAILYTGDLAQFLDRGIALTLLGAIAASLIGAAMLSYRGAILGPQDVPAILLAGAAAGIVAKGTLPPDVLFATVVCLIAVTTLITGVLGSAIGKLRLAHVTRFFPYPVLAGFLATTGVLLFLGGINVAVGPLGPAAMDAYVSPDFVMRWAPVVVAAGVMLIATRLFHGYLVLPLTLIFVFFGFYAFYAALGLSMEQLSDAGFLLGPFKDVSTLSTIDPGIPFKADWLVILQNAPLILTAALSALMGATLNASGLELALRRDFEMNQEMKGTGLANILAGMCGGIPGYHVVSQTLLANRLGLAGALAGISAAAGCAFVLIQGAGALGQLPIGFFAAVIAYLGLDLLFSWLWDQRRRLRPLDLSIVLLIPLIAVGYGFLTAIAVGLMMACILFIVDYGKLNVIRFQSDMSTRRSLLERADLELEVLMDAGKAAKIVELSTFLFFGSANPLRSKIKSIIEGTDGLRWLVLDFKQVHGVDVSTMHTLLRIEEDCLASGLQLVLTGLPLDTQLDLRKASDRLETKDTLEAAIEQIEDVLLAESSADCDQRTSILHELEGLFSENGLEAYTEHMALEPGDVIIEEAATSKDIFLLQSGRLRVVSLLGNGQETVLAYIQPGSVVGEMASYSNRARSAAIIADRASTVLRIDMNLMGLLEVERPEVAGRFHKLMARDMARRLHRTSAMIRDLKL